MILELSPLTSDMKRFLRDVETTSPSSNVLSLIDLLNKMREKLLVVIFLTEIF